MSYQITIKKIEQVKVTRRGEYGVIDKRPWTDQELAEEMSSMYRGKEQFLEKNPLRQVMGYQPNREEVEDKETKVLEQTVESLDLAAVIKAVNGL